MEWLFAQPVDSILSTRILIVLIATAAASAAFSALGAFTVGGGKYAAVGSGSVPLAFLAGFVLFLGPPEIGSAHPLDLLPYIILLGLIAGLIVDTATHIENVRLAVLLAWPGIVVVGIGWREMPDFATIAGLPMALLWLSGVLGYLWLGLEHRPQSAPIVGLLAITVGLTLIAYIGDSKTMTVLGAIFAIALFAFLLFNWPNMRFPLLGVGNLAVGGAVLALAVALVLYTDAPRDAVALLLFVFAAPPIAARLPLGASAAAGPIVLMLVSAIPVAGAALLALNSASGP